jgi:hypothetical protein
MVKLCSKSIHVVALIGCLALILPLSAIIQETQDTFMRTAVFHGCPSTSATDRSSDAASHPSRPCPVLELRAGLVLFSVKPSSNIEFAAINIANGTDIRHVLPGYPSTQFHSVARTSATDPSMLQVLRI